VGDAYPHKAAYHFSPEIIMRLHIGAASLSAGAQLTAATILFHGNPIVTASLTSSVTGADLAGLLVTAWYLMPFNSPPCVYLSPGFFL
jgi:hypothetical protein